MNLKEMVEKLGLEVKSGAGQMDREVRGGYASDLMSDVMANSRQGDVWVTLQIHQNIVAVASLRELAAIIIVQGRQPEKETVEKAEREGIPILGSPLHTFELVGRLYQMGISGMH
jgi:predicted transcriptional regulator